MAKMEFQGKSKELVEAERKAREADPNYVPPENKINVLDRLLTYKPEHQKQQIRVYSSFKEGIQDIDKYIDECIKDATVRGVISFIFVTPGHKVYIGITPAL